MTNLLRELQESFCKELNQVWTKDIENNDGANMDTSRFADLVALMREAREQGYVFHLHYSCAEFIAERIMESGTEKNLYELPAWETIKPIIKMIEECDRQDWQHLKPHLENLKSLKVQPILQEYTIEFARENGPFYPGKDNSLIKVYGYYGSVGADLLLASLVYGPKEKQLH